MKNFDKYLRGTLNELLEILDKQELVGTVSKHQEGYDEMRRIINEALLSINKADEIFK